LTPAAPPPPAGPPPPVSPTHNAEAILADRLARGEIQPDDYRAAITVLRETAAPG
jgi:putative membrane protein